MTAILKWSLGVFAFSQAVISTTYAKLPDITAAELIEAIKSADSRIVNVDCKYTVDEQFIKGLYGDWMPEKRKLEIHWRKEGIREYTDVTCYDGRLRRGKPLPFRFVLAFNGEGRKQWQPNDNKGDIFKKPHRHNWPVPIDFGMTLGERDKKLGESLADCEITNIRQEKWQGHECYFVEAIRPSGIKVDVWIDPEIGWRARRLRLWNPDGLIRRDSSGEFKDCGNGAWFPVEGVFRYYKNDKSSGERVVSIERRLKVEQVKINADLTQKDFEIQFPHGTFVYVHTLNASYIAGVTSLDGFGEEALNPLVGKPLPDMKEIAVDHDPNQTKDKMILVCFWDMNQRPSRHLIAQLAKQAEQLNRKGVTIIAVQASKVDGNKLNEWVEKNNIPFPVGVFQGDEEKTRFAWGVRSLPWLILTDKQHVVTAEGFNPAELDIEKLSVSELLGRYAANQDKFKSFIVKSQITQKNIVTEKEGAAPYSKVKREIFEFRYEDDGANFRAYYCTKDVHSVTDGSEVPADRQNSYLWDRKHYYEYHKAPILDASNVFVSFSTKDMKNAITIGYFGAGSILGFLYGDVERFDSILRQTDSISVRDELERIGLVDCYVIDAKSKHGTYTVWLDPEHGYGIAKVDVHRGPKDLRWGRPLDSYKFAPYDRDTFSIRNVRFESIEGLWVPMEADFRIDSKGPNRAETIDIHHKVTELLLNPDHDALGSFVTDIENGTSVRIQEAPGIRYKWQDGMKFVVDAWDGSIRYVPKEWSILVGVGKPLPKFEGIKIKLSAQQIKDMAILLCFFDMNQRPSRYCIKQLAQKAAGLKEKGVTVAAVQTSQVTEKTLNEWIKKYNILFPLGAITADIEKTRFAWGVRSLPWLILTDKQHVVTAEGFTVAELDEKLDNNSKY